MEVDGFKEQDEAIEPRQRPSGSCRQHVEIAAEEATPGKLTRGEGACRLSLAGPEEEIIGRLQELPEGAVSLLSRLDLP